jgi:hypothetical protein
MDLTENVKGCDEAEASWNAQTEELLVKWRKRVYAAQSAYYVQAEKLRFWHYVLGIVVVVVSAIAGASFLKGEAAGASWISDRTLHVLVAALSSVAAILAGLQTFLRLSESATHHGVAADWYTSIRRDIEQLLALPPALRGDPRSRLDSIRKEMNKAGQNAPALGERVWARSAQRFEVDEPAFDWEPKKATLRTTRGSKATT